MTTDTAFKIGEIAMELKSDPMPIYVIFRLVRAVVQCIIEFV